MSDNKPHSIIVFREYTDANGEVKTQSHNAGVAFKTKSGDGFNCQLVDGIALTGKFSILPRTERTTGTED